MSPGPLNLIHEDAHLLAVNKPAGIATQGRDPVAPSMEDWVRAYLDPEDPTCPYLGTVHRLDRPVSGVMLWAKTPRAARRLAEQFAGRSVEKSYVAIVSGRGRPSESHWDDWLCEEDTGLGVVQVCRPGTPRARQAHTRVEVGRSWVEHGADFTRLRLLPRTGRTHQLRVQAASRGWPIVGDHRYGSTVPFEGGIALHAYSIAFRHPTTDEPIFLVADWPSSWSDRGWAEM